MLKKLEFKKITKLYLTAFLIFLSISTLPLILVNLDYSGFHIRNVKKVPDFLAYYTGAKIIESGGVRNLYDAKTQRYYQHQAIYPLKITGLLAFKAPPVTALLVSPLAKFDYFRAYSVMLLINLAVLTTILILYYKKLHPDKKIFLYFLLAVPLFEPISENINHGQTSMIILLIISGSYFLLREGKPFLGGFILGLVFLKTQHIIIIPLLIALFYKESWIKKFALGSLLSLVLLVMICIRAQGIQFLFDYPKYLFTSESINFGTNVALNYNVSSILALFIKKHALVNQLNIAINAPLYFALLAILGKYGSRMNQELSFSAVLMLTPLLNLHTMSSDIVLFLLSLLLVGGYLLSNKKYKQLTIFALLMFILSWSSYINLVWVATITFLIMAFWVLKESFGGDGGIRTPVLKAEKLKSLQA